MEPTCAPHALQATTRPETPAPQIRARAQMVRWPLAQTAQRTEQIFARRALPDSSKQKKQKAAIHVPLTRTRPPAPSLGLLARRTPHAMRPPPSNRKLQVPPKIAPAAQTSAPARGVPQPAATTALRTATRIVRVATMVTGSVSSRASAGPSVTAANTRRRLLIRREIERALQTSAHARMENRRQVTRAQTTTRPSAHRVPATFTFPAATASTRRANLGPLLVRAERTRPHYRATLPIESALKTSVHATTARGHEAAHAPSTTEGNVLRATQGTGSPRTNAKSIPLLAAPTRTIKRSLQHSSVIESAPSKFVFATTAARAQRESRAPRMPQSSAYRAR